MPRQPSFTMNRAERIQKLLDGTKANRQLVREEMLAGSNLAHFHQELLEQEQWFSSHLVEIRAGMPASGAPTGDIPSPASAAESQL